MIDGGGIVLAFLSFHRISSVLSSVMRVLFYTRDLMFISQVSGEVRERGGTYITVSSGQELLDHAMNQQTDLVVLDLSVPKSNPAQVVTSLRQLTKAPRSIVGFAPHVHEQKLKAAKEAGCDVVLSKGQFHRELTTLLDQIIS